MPTTVTTDKFMRNFAFQVDLRVLAADGVTTKNDVNGNPMELTAGFHTASLPEINFDSAEFREGSGSGFRFKYKGLPTVNDVTLQRGAVINNGNQTNGMGAVEQMLNDALALHQQVDCVITQFNPNQTITYELKGAFVRRVKFVSDVDSMSSEVSINEIELQYEQPLITVSSDVQWDGVFSGDPVS